MKIPERKNNLHAEKMLFKKCLFPGCDGYFQGTGYSKYCPEHRKKEHRKTIDKLKKKDTIKPNNNQYYKHDKEEISTVIFHCALCNEPFDLKVYPTIFTYPKYCPEHRNEFRRLWWMKKNGIVPVEEKPEPVMKEVVELPIPDPDIKEDVVVVDNEVILDYDDDIELTIFEDLPEEKNG